MKKIFKVFMVLAILLSYYAPLIEVKAEDVPATTCSLKYRVMEHVLDGSETQIGCTSDYNEAKTVMNNHNSTVDKVALIYQDGKLVNAKYAMVNLSGRASLIRLYQKPTDSTYYTYVNGDWGSDAAFIDYDPATNMVKIKISGFSGWTSFSNADIIPITEINVNSIKIAHERIRIRSTADLGVGDTNWDGSYVYDGYTYRYYDKVNVDGYTWYKIAYSGYPSGYGWIASDTDWVRENSNMMKTYYEVSVNKNLIHYYRTSTSQPYTNLGIAPTYLQQGVPYYSFDGNYFYTNLVDMLSDYKIDNTYSKAFNKNTPFYQYFMYLPTHSKTGYTASDFNQIIINKGYSAEPDPRVTYVTYNAATGNYEWVSGINRGGLSKLYNQGQYFIEAANTYGINALMMFGVSINESGNGDSLLSFYKNNLFGLGAADSAPISSARSYASARESILDYAAFTGSAGSSYTYPSGKYYYGSHYGNKGSGMGVMYASDPYWGEKQAANSYTNDKNYGGQDYKANTVGIKLTNESIPIKKSPSSSSATIYNLVNAYYNQTVDNMPLIVMDKITTTEEGTTKTWYKVYSDGALDASQNLTTGNYSFTNSYGYIEAKYLYVENNQPVINASDITIKEASNYDVMTNVTASDVEDGNLTSNIEYTTNLDVNKVGHYTVTYTVTDNRSFSASKTVNVDVIQTDYPIIYASNVTLSQYTTYNPLTNVTASDYKDGNITNNITVVENNVNMNVVGTYTVKFKVINSLGLETTKTINVTVVSNASPVISATDRNIKINSTFNALEGISASDLEDGNLTSKITVTSNNVDTTILGTYSVTYQVTDNNGNLTTKTVTIKVEDINYITKPGDFYFESMKWNDSTNKLDLSGYLAIKGINNRASDVITYDLILKSNTSSVEIVLPLERWLTDTPTRHYSDGNYDYSATWFKGSVDLDNIPHGEYTLYVRARSGENESINLFRNVFLKAMTRKAQSDNGHGFLFRNNSYKSEFPMELFVYDNGLINLEEPTHQSNMITSYKTIGFSGNNLNIMGTSYNIGGNYSSSINVERTLILEEISSHLRYTYNIGSYVGAEIPLRIDDGFSKVKAWFNTEGNVDVSNLPKGKYIIYLHTKTSNVDDFGELYDIFLKSLSSAQTTINGKNYTITLNNTLRFRLELTVN